MSWEDQGRQYHMWFGHGTAGNKAAKAAPGSSVIGQSIADRVLALAYGALASLPAAQRRQAEAQYHNGTLPRLKEAMTAWLRATALNQTAFASRLFGRSADNPVVRNLHSAALRAATATTHDDFWEAAGKLAQAMEAVGIDRWPHFVAEAQQRARDPATQAAIEKSRQPPDPGRDAIRRVYPLETAIGVAAAGLAGGTAAAARAAGGALLRQFLPRKGSEGSQSTQNSPQTAGSTAGEPNFAAESGVLRSAAQGKGNFGLGNAKAEMSDRLGQAWVGKNSTLASDGRTLVSQDGLRQYRPSSFKPNLGRAQANFEQRSVPKGQWQSNGHLDIVN